jgi:hypothetical protein
MPDRRPCKIKQFVLTELKIVLQKLEISPAGESEVREVPVSEYR